MKATTILSSLAATGLVVAQDIQSKPFNLVIEKSADKALDGQALSTCHTGAAIESICILKDSKATFYHNTTKGVQPGPGGEPGILTWILPSKPPIPSSMTLSTDPSTNVALPLFFPGSNNVQSVAFDKSEELNIASYIDDTKTPPSSQAPRVLKNWYVCDTIYAGYKYKTLAWTLGQAKPQNPSCIKVEVKRVFT